MKKVLLVVIPMLLAIAVFSAIVFFANKKASGKGALQITANPQAKVFLNGKSFGKTPLCLCEQSTMIPIGNYSLRLMPIDSSIQTYEENITINPSVLTVVDRTFGDIGKSTGWIITLSPNKDTVATKLVVESIPLNSDVSVDSNPSGQTPLSIDQITESDHNIVISKMGYDQKTIPIHTRKGYTLDVLAYLPVNLNAQALTTATASAQITLAPTPTPAGPQVIILQTPTGFLRVRTEPDLSGSESARVNPGDVFPLLSEQDGWYQIQLTNGQTGWISGSYAKKQ